MRHKPSLLALAAGLLVLGCSDHGNDQGRDESGMHEGAVEDTLTEGWMVSYYDNGLVKDSSYYVQGELDSLQITYNRDQNIIKECHWKNGVLHGDFYELDYEDSLDHEDRYVQGATIKPSTFDTDKGDIALTVIDGMVEIAAGALGFHSVEEMNDEVKGQAAEIRGFAKAFLNGARGAALDVQAVESRMTLSDKWQDGLSLLTVEVGDVKTLRDETLSFSASFVADEERGEGGVLISRNTSTDMVTGSDPHKIWALLNAGVENAPIKVGGTVGYDFTRVRGFGTTYSNEYSQSFPGVSYSGNTTIKALAGNSIHGPSLVTPSVVTYLQNDNPFPKSNIDSSNK